MLGTRCLSKPHPLFPFMASNSKPKLLGYLGARAGKQVESGGQASLPPTILKPDKAQIKPRESLKATVPGKGLTHRHPQALREKAYIG